MTIEEIMSIIIDSPDSEDNHVYYGLGKGSMDIQLKDYDDKYFYTVYKNGEVTKHSKKDNIQIDSGYIATLLDANREYVLYSDIPVVRAGYLRYHEKIPSKKIITFIFDSLVLSDYGITYCDFVPADYSNRIRKLEMRKGQYMITLCTVSATKQLNFERKIVGAKCLPYMKSIKSNDALYLYIVKESKLHNYIGSEDRIKTGNIIHDIVDGCKELYPEINMKWKGLSTRYLFY